MKGKQKVLIVEDNSDLRRLYAIGLNQRGFEVKLASNGAEAVERIETETPDIILLDLIMPIMDGWEVIDRVSASERSSQTPVIVISGQMEPGDDRRHPRIGAWLEKPVTIDELVQKITEVTSRDH